MKFFPANGWKIIQIFALTQPYYFDGILNGIIRLRCHTQFALRSFIIAIVKQKIKCLPNKKSRLNL